MTIIVMNEDGNRPYDDELKRYLTMQARHSYMDYQNQSNNVVTEIELKTCTKDDYNRTDQLKEIYEETKFFHPYICLNNTDELYFLSKHQNYKTQRSFFNLSIRKCVGDHCETN